MTRERLIAGAFEVFERDGYSAATVEDIVRAAGASRATFYLHFNSKLELVLEIIGPQERDAQKLWEELDQIGAPSREELKQWLQRTFDFFEHYKAGVTLVQQAMAVEPELEVRVSQDLEWLVDRMATYLSRWHGAGKRVARARALLLIVQHERFCYLWLVRGWKHDRAVVLEAMTDLWWQTLHAKA